METNNPRTLTADNIYPGKNLTTLVVNPINAHTFVDVFSEITNWLKAKDLEKYLQDPDGKLIKPKHLQQDLLVKLEESTVTQHYNSIRAQR